MARLVRFISPAKVWHLLMNCKTDKLLFAVVAALNEGRPQMSKTQIKHLIPATLVFSMLTIPAGLAANVELRSKFTLSFLGVGVGKMKSNVSIAGSSYSISGSAKTGKFVSIVSNSKAGFSSKGRITGNRIYPSAHTLNYKSRKKSGAVRLSFADGDVIKSVVTPNKRIKPDTIPVQPTHLKAVLDPISSLLFPVMPNEIGNGHKICNRTLPVYGGRARLNLVFSYLKSGKGRARGFNGETFTCAVRYQPVSGHRPSKKGVKFMQANRNMRITMARIGNSNVYGLFAFSVKTDKGTASGHATKFASR